MSGSQRRRPVFNDQFGPAVGFTVITSRGKPFGSGAKHIHMTPATKEAVTIVINDQDTLAGCDRPCKRGLAFAHTGELDNQPAILKGYVGGVETTYQGIIKKVSGKGSRRWALHNATRL